MKKIGVLVLSLLITTAVLYLLVFPSLAAQRLTVSTESFPALSTPSPEMVPSVSSAPVLVSQPVKLKIEKIAVEADIENVGMDEAGRMDVPEKDEDVAWYELGAKPGQWGSAVVAGHLDTRTGQPAVFAKLDSLVPGDEIKIIDEVGQTKVFIVRESSVYPDAEFPIAQVFGRSDGRWLNLITCEGQFDQNAQNYLERRVIFAELSS